MVELRTLRKMSIFEDLSERELDAVAPLCEPKQFAKGETLFLEDRPATQLFTLISGRVMILMDETQGRRALVYSVQPGQAFSWSALVQPRRYTASAVAVETSDVIVINGRKLSRVFKQNYELGYKIMCRVAQLISKRLRHTRLQLLNIHESDRHESE